MDWRAVEIAKRLVPARGPDVTAQLLGVPLKSINRIAKSAPPPMTSDEMTAAIDVFLRTDASRAAFITGRSPEEIVAAAERRGLLSDIDAMSRYERWTDTDNKILLRAYYGRMPDHQLTKWLGRSVEAIKCRRAQLGLKATGNPQWSDPEDTLLRELWRRISSRAIAQRLNRSDNAVRARARHLSLSSST